MCLIYYEKGAPVTDSFDDLKCWVGVAGVDSDVGGGGEGMEGQPGLGLLGLDKE